MRYEHIGRRPLLGVPIRRGRVLGSFLRQIGDRRWLGDNSTPAASRFMADLVVTYDVSETGRFAE